MTLTFSKQLKEKAPPHINKKGRNKLFFLLFLKEKWAKKKKQDRWSSQKLLRTQTRTAEVRSEFCLRERTKRYSSDELMRWFSWKWLDISQLSQRGAIFQRKRDAPNTWFQCIVAAGPYPSSLGGVYQPGGKKNKKHKQIWSDSCTTVSLEK